MVLLKKCISIFCSIAIICSLMAFNVSAANYLDTPWSANFDPDQGGFPDWSDIYKVLDPENYPEYGRSMLMTSWYRDVPYFNGVLDKAAGVYCFSFEVYATSESSNISTMLSKELYDPSWSLFDLIYDFSDGTMRYYVPDKTSTSKTNQVTSIEKLAAKTWHQFDYIINLNDMTVSCYVNGKPAYTKDVPYNTADAIKTGTYSPVGFVGSGSEVYWDNLEAGPYSENSFDAKSGSLAGLPEGVTSVDIAFEHSVYAATLTSERISAKKYSSDDLLMQNGTPLEISVSNAKARSVTVDIGEPVQGGCFYSLSMDNVVDINKGGFKEKTKVFMVGAEKTETVVDDTFDDYTGGTPEGYSCWKSVNGVPASFDGSEGLKMFDSADSATAPDEVYKDYAPFKTTFNAFNESFSDIRMDKGLMFRFVDTNTGVGRKIPLSSNNGKIKISFDAARSCGTDDGFNHTNMYF